MTFVCRRWKVTKGAYLRVGSARRGIRLDASACHPDAEAFRGEYPAPGRAQGTFGGAGGCDEHRGAPVRYVSPFLRALRAFSFVYGKGTSGV